MKALSRALTEKVLEVSRVKNICAKKENRRNKLLKKAKAKNGSSVGTISSKSKDGEIEGEDEDSISSLSLEKAEKQIENTAVGQVRNLLRPTQFGGVEKRLSLCALSLLSTHKVSQYF